MGQSVNYAAMTDAQIKLRKVDFAGDMEQRSNVAATNDVRSVKEAWGSDQIMQQRRMTNLTL